jgi:glycosyltransferase involved in cell wall biosynthesis
MDFGGLKVLMISSDRNILTAGSAVSERMKEYGRLVEELHIVLLSDAAHGLKDTVLDKNVHVYPTNSSIKFLRPNDAASLGKKIVVEKKFVRGKSLITAQDPFECGLAGLRVKKAWRLPLEVQLHTDPFSPYFSGFLNLLRKRIAKKVLKHADAVRAVSEELADSVSKKFFIPSAKISVLPIYVDIKKIEEGKVKFDLHARFGWHFIILSVARITAEKNLNAAIRILAKVRKYYPDTGLVILGDGPLRESLESLAKSLGVSSAVVFPGWEENTASYYRTANLFLQTSKFEGYGLALVEAGLSGLPVVTTPVGIARELENGKDAIICPDGDEDFMFKAIYDLIKDNGKREMLRTHLKRTLEQKLLTKETYLAELKQSWEKASAIL